MDDYKVNEHISVGDTIEFNTGHQYSDEGQRIEAEVIDKSEDGFWLTIKFNDKDRGIQGVMTAVSGLTERHIIEKYNRNEYI